MPKQDMLKPIDVAALVGLAVNTNNGSPTYSQLATTLGVSSSTTFESVQRLEASGLLRPGTREPNLAAFMSFLEHGLRYAFPAKLGREAKGVPTAHSGPALQRLFDDAKPVVWPDVDGSARGTSLTPLYPKATTLPRREPEVYNVLTLVDALRVGQARERKAAMDALNEILGAKSK